MENEISPHPFPSRPLRLVVSEGTEYEMGRAHGESLKSEVATGMPKFYHDFWQRMSVGPTGQSVIEKWGRKGALALLDTFVIRRLQHSLPQWGLDRIRGMADGAGALPDDYLLSAVLPDVFPVLETFLAKVNPKKFIAAKPPIRLGCTSFVAMGDRMLHGRNLDFPGVAFWDRYPVIQRFKSPTGMNYLGLTTAGVPIAGITGINEAQISVSVHQHYCREANLAGVPPFTVGENVLREAQSLSEAIRILEAAKTASAWAYVLTDGKRRQACIVEKTPSTMAVRDLTKRESLTHSNFYQTGACSRSEFATTARMNWDNHYRNIRLQQLLKRSGEALTPAAAVKTISDHFDPFWGEEKILNRTVAQVYNIQSLVLDPVSMTLWIAEGNCPVQLRSFKEYDLSAAFSGGTLTVRGELPAFEFHDPLDKQAKEKYILSFVSAFAGDWGMAQEKITESLSLRFCPEVGQVAGVLHLKAQNYSKARELFAQARETIENKARQLKKKLPPEYFELRVFEARAADLQGDSAAAKGINDDVVTHSDLEDEHLRRLAATSKRYAKEQLDKIVMPYSSYIPFE